MLLTIPYYSVPSLLQGYYVTSNKSKISVRQHPGNIIIKYNMIIIIH